MTTMRPFARLLWVPVAFAAAACQYPDAYVSTPREFDRSAPGFREVPLDRSSVTVCASPFRADDQGVMALADAECQRYGKTAKDPTVAFGTCPLLLASVVVFRCVPPAL